jgi:hypothetical protein
MTQPLPKDHPSYPVILNAAKTDPRWLELLQPEDRCVETEASPIASAKIAATARRPLPCIALGPLVERKGCNCRRNDLHTCLKGLGTVSPSGKCESCHLYEADD